MSAVVDLSLLDVVIAGDSESDFVGMQVGLSYKGETIPSRVTKVQYVGQDPLFGFHLYRLKEASLDVN